MGGIKIKNAVLIACQNKMPSCFGCAPCIAGLLAKGINVVTHISCGGAPGISIGGQLNAINMWFDSHPDACQKPTIIYGHCITECGKCKPKMSEMIASATNIKEIEEFKHPFAPKKLFEKV